MNNSGYKRFPTIHDVRVVFVSEDDLWEVPSTGGMARRLTSNSGEVTNPHFSPDGKYIAFSGKEEGEKDVYVIPEFGGVNRRLTFIGKNTKVIGWTSDSTHVLFSSDANQPFAGRNEIYKVSIRGGLHQKLSYGVANNIAFGPSGGILLGRNTLDSARWKRYKGGTAGVFWIDKTGKGNYEKFLINIKGNLGSPSWIGERIYFISDHEGLGKLYSCNIKGDDIQCHSKNKEYYIRNASSDGNKIVYHSGGEIFLYDPKKDEEIQIEIQYHSTHIQRQRKFIETEKYLEDYNINSDGSLMTVTSRGKSYVFSSWEGPVIQIGKGHGVRYRLTQWLQDKKSIVTISDDGGSESIEVHKEIDGKKNIKRLKNLDFGIAARMVVSPKENKIAVSNNHHKLLFINMDDEVLTEVAKSKFERIEDFSFSPDGKWIVYSMSNAEFLSSLYLYNIDTKENHQITSPGFKDFQPTFDPQGRYIYFLSARSFNPVYDTSYFQLGFPLGIRPYLISLRKDIPSPFTPEYSNLFKTSSKEKKEKNKSKDITVNIDVENIQERIISFPLPEKNYSQIIGIKDGLLYSRDSIKGSLLHLHWDKQPQDEALERFDFHTQKSEQVSKKVSNFKVSMNGRTLVYRTENKLFLKANLFEHGGNEHGGDEHENRNMEHHSRSKSDWIDLSRVKVNLNPISEWKQMYSEAWRLQKEHYWTSDMAGIDWHLVYNRYLPLLDKIASRAEFSDLIWEMQGELGTSHAYEWGGDYKLVPDYKLGSLAADFEFDEKENAYKIIHIVKGDSWNNDSPLKSIGIDINEGDFLQAINGESLNAEISPNTLLVNQANNIISLTIKSLVSGEIKTFNVRTLQSDTDARYREWVEKNRYYVHSKSEGKLGYVHVPDMGPRGFSEFHKYYINEVNREGLIVDIRNNGGGHVSQLILEKLSRKHFGYDVSRYGSIGTYPCHSVAGPIVAITNEYAGSDGDIFSHHFKQMKLGTLVGKRTWGGVIGINPRYPLADGTMTTQPEYATYMKDVGWAVENYGTDPDIEIDITPEDYANGKDSQLDKAIEVALDQLKSNPVIFPLFDNRPSMMLPPFEIIKNGDESKKNFQEIK